MFDTSVKLYNVYRIKVCTDYYGPAPMRTETLSIVASSLDECLKFLHSLYKREDNLYSYEILDKIECIVL